MLSRIFTGPNITFYTVLGICIMVLGGLVCGYSVPIKNKLTGRKNTDEETLAIKLAGLGIVAAGLIVTVYVS